MRVYLDNGATSKTDERVVEAMLPYFTEDYGNPASLHTFGQTALEGVKKAREKLAKFINAEADEIIFTSGGTESDNMVIQGIAKEGDHIITTKIEHPAILESCAAMEKRGVEVTYLDVDNEGYVKPEVLKSAIKKNTKLVSIMMANNEIGTIQDMEKLGAICKEKGVLFHTDAVQAVGKVSIDVKAMNIDLLSASGHKIHGPKGIGILYVKNGIKVRPLIFGGGHESGMRSGTSNTTGIIGFAKAIELCNVDVKEMVRLRDKIIDSLLELPDSRLNGPKDRLPNNVNVAFKYIEGEGILLHLDGAGIAVSTGSACSSLSLKPSHVLLAIGLKPENSHGSVRITLSRYNTEAEVDYFLKELRGVITKLRALSPFGGK